MKCFAVKCQMYNGFEALKYVMASSPDEARGMVLDDLLAGEGGEIIVVQEVAA